MSEARDPACGAQPALDLLVERRGMGIGAASGAALLAIGATSGDIDIRRDLVVAAGALSGGGLGAAAGVLSAGPEIIYRAPEAAKP